MSTGSDDRPALLAALEEGMRTVSAATVLLSQAVADRLGLNPTDVECLDILQRFGPLTAKRLAELTGLTTGGVTFAVDRLERAGYARRRPNPQDRRSVLIELLSEPTARDVVVLFEPMGHAMNELYARYGDADLATIVDFITRGNRITRDHIDRLRSG